MSTLNFKTNVTENFAKSYRHFGYPKTNVKLEQKKRFLVILS